MVKLTIDVDKLSVQFALEPSELRNFILRRRNAIFSSDVLREGKQSYPEIHPGSIARRPIPE